MIVAVRSRHCWLDAFFLLCSMAFAPYFWLIERIITLRSSHNEPRGVGSNGARAMKKNTTERDCAVVDDDSPPANPVPPPSQGIEKTGESNNSS